MTRIWTSAVLALIVILTGCGSAPRESAEQVKPAEPVAVADEVNGATLTGKVAFTGKPPVPAEIDMSASPVCARAHAAAPARSEEVVVNRNGTLKNVFVWIKVGLAARRWAAPSTPVVLEQQGCIYRPHVLGIMTGQPLRIENGDGTNHNIHTMPVANVEANVSQPPKGDPIVRTFAREEVMIPVKCNVHPWMKVWIGAVSHPFFAVTGDDGSFAIKGLPPGTYTVEAWHEKYGTRQMQVTVGAKESRNIDLSFQG